MDKVTPLVPEESVPFVGQALRTLRAEVGNKSTVLGFVGAPFTLATYIVEVGCGAWGVRWRARACLHGGGKGVAVIRTGRSAGEFWGAWVRG